MIRTITLFLLLTLAAPMAIAGMADGGAAIKAKDYERAYMEYKPLAEAGNAEAQNNLGVLCRNGLGVVQNHVQTVAWYRMAAVQGVAESQTILGFLYQRGVGIKKNLVAAYVLYSLARESNPERGKTAQHQRSQRRSELTSAQLDDAEKLIAEMRTPGQFLKSLDAFTASGAQ